jgi:glycine cleavage system H protein
MSTPDGLKFTRDHEWARVEGDRVVVGITDYAQDALGDIVFVDLPAAGQPVSRGDQVAEVESTKTVSSVMSPVSGEILEAHDALGGNPDQINADPYGEGWFFAVRASHPEELDGLMDRAAYDAYVAEISG